VNTLKAHRQCPAIQRGFFLLELIIPYKPKKPCSKDGCPNLIPIGKRYCEAHAPKDTRPSAARRGYGGKWQKIRAYVLRVTPYCFRCGGVATEVHHVLPIADGGTHDLANLMPLCKTHHSQITGRR
jgi:5-methylcytosine-specific restriction enzyme A